MMSLRLASRSVFTRRRSYTLLSDTKEGSKLIRDAFSLVSSSFSWCKEPLSLQEKVHPKTYIEKQVCHLTQWQWYVKKHLVQINGKQERTEMLLLNGFFTDDRSGHFPFYRTKNLLGHWWYIKSLIIEWVRSVEIALTQLSLLRKVVWISTPIFLLWTHWCLLKSSLLFNVSLGATISSLQTLDVEFHVVSLKTPQNWQCLNTKTQCNQMMTQK